MTPRVGERLDPYPQLVLDRRRGGLAVQNRRRHDQIVSRPPPADRTTSLGPSAANCAGAAVAGRATVGGQPLGVTVCEGR